MAYVMRFLDSICDLIPSLLQYLLKPERLLLALFWSFLVLCCVGWCFVADRFRIPVCVKRKFFHFIASVIFITGIQYDPSFLCLASVAALSLFFTSEGVRISGPRKISDAISMAIAPFLDSKDQGIVIWSHIFLLLGLSMPLWLDLMAYQFRMHSVVSYAGVVTIGIGDSFAAIIGSYFGRIPWKGRNRTVEGSAAMLISQILFLEFIGLVDPVIFLNSALQRRLAFIVHCVCTTAAEALLHGSDNVFIPLLSVMLVWPLRS
ncbi:dolichol kinase-like [Paramacrobiotus metropolitanus]|uniref:dolichol kinase-like n=1 Tax=Paramacrobiotus metropolitanus TaxID=2943436 RepID=UPI00244659C6|nr:dolichol kinase-like [Paramacrobiotus metropolitanus]